jgi:hypothetical protein
MWLGSVIKTTHQVYDPSGGLGFTTKLTMRDEQMVGWMGNAFPSGFTALANHGG